MYMSLFVLILLSTVLVTCNSTYITLYMDKRSTNSSNTTLCGSSPLVLDACSSLSTVISSYLNITSNNSENGLPLMIYVAPGTYNYTGNSDLSFHGLNISLYQTPKTEGQVTFDFTAADTLPNNYKSMFTISVDTWDGPYLPSAISINNFEFLNVNKVINVGIFGSILNISIISSTFNYISYGGELLSMNMAHLTETQPYINLDISGSTFNNISSIASFQPNNFIIVTVVVSDSQLRTDLPFNQSDIDRQLIQFEYGSLLLENVDFITSIPLITNHVLRPTTFTIIGSNFTSIPDSPHLIDVAAGYFNVSSCIFTNTKIHLTAPGGCEIIDSKFDHNQFYFEIANCFINNSNFIKYNGTDLICLDYFTPPTEITFTNLKTNSPLSISNNGCIIQGIPKINKKLPAWAISLINVSVDIEVGYNRLVGETENFVIFTE
ncbi:hypothetical protein PPL_12358 [Heterostelium album PN500]|uniref:IPT/TIG domain-containing protein n=1 Tax=Heterostelium pallidum (strain ATCC 26659 / Pp 5 / PN500) TaxID=670386 RepID=D3BMD8_HETP5|nr:hypothetical protein PPL_12358 [Heterostelium album PN500]EFA77150.1 hypothetical protein PPL_12358 [Heterostelium album PN500]|eukprot:XP_020429279.1 hypothetical protein PPL_12358 [Heterostelium album PN500]